MPRTSGPNYYFYLYFLVFLVFIITVNPLTGQIGTNRTWMTLTSSEPAEAEIILQYSDIETSRVEFQVGGFWREHIRNMEGVAEEKMYLSNSTPMLIKGAPDLDKLTISLIIPDRSKMQVFIIEEEYVDIPDIHIIPSKGNLTRDINPADVPYEYGREYRADAFFPGVAAELRTPHIIRDVRGQVMVIYPFRYNPVQKILRVYTRLVVEVKAVGDDGENILTERREDGKTVRAFEGIYARKFLNYNEYRSASRYVPLEEDGNMLVISYGAFMADMQDFVDWKNMSGIPTEIVDVSSIGTTASQIKTYVANYYNTNGLTFLLLVGDAAQVPTSQHLPGILIMITVISWGATIILIFSWAGFPLKTFLMCRHRYSVRSITRKCLTPHRDIISGPCALHPLKARVMKGNTTGSTSGTSGPNT
jgi:hypothetical protein